MELNTTTSLGVMETFLCIEEAILDKAAADIAQEKKKAINDAKNEISDVALSIAEKVVERQINAEDQSSLISQFIDNLGDAL